MMLSSRRYLKEDKKPHLVGTPNISSKRDNVQAGDLNRGHDKGVTIMNNTYRRPIVTLTDQPEKQLRGACICRINELMKNNATPPLQKKSRTY